MDDVGEGQPLHTAGRDILVVDDVEANILSFEAVLAPIGRKIVRGRSGREALSWLLVHDAALILLDVQMPGMDGYEVARLIRGRERSRDVPILFITAFDHDAEDVRRAYRLGAVDFLFKPVDPDILRAKAQVFLDIQDRTAELGAREAADQRKDEFLAILAHELRGPLAPLQTSIELIERDPTRLSPRVTGIWGRQVRHLTRLVDDLLDVSRFAAGKIVLCREEVDLATVIDEAIAACRPLIDARRHTLVVAPTRDTPAVIGDPVRLVQIVTNLVTNAAKYTPSGGRIDVAIGVEGPDAFVRVSDTGRGIAPALIGRVFDMFVQERASADGHGGLGLGLALVRRLVQLHGGTVSASSDGPGHGSRFEVRLPASATAVRLPTLRMKAVLPEPPRRPLRAVVVDDDDDLRDMLAELLVSCGHEVATAEDGGSGLALIRARCPDVALVDISLPVLDGYEVARTLRAAGDHRNLRLVAMTGFGSVADVERAQAAGFDAHIVKPATARTILLALDGDT